MPTTTRQTNLLVSEDWKKIYQTFKEADFQSYDFETLRKSMIDYLRLYYPEDFNDFIESSEYVALIDLIAFLGQALAFRTDLNARESFIDTAERRDSILKLARLVNYTPKRNIPATGLLKVDSVTTTESIIDSTGFQLANQLITWDDVSNDNWLEQFNLIINSTLVNSQVIGKPGNSQTINNIKTDEYSINTIPGSLPVVSFTQTVNGVDMRFEAVSATTIGKGYIYENEPGLSGIFNILYRNDSRGNASNNTGFFTMFKQGQLTSETLRFEEAIPNRAVRIGLNNVNNNDVWLYSVNTDNQVDRLWTPVPIVSGVNVIYNKQESKAIYQTSTLAGDQIELVFGDGSFAEIPQGTFEAFVRVSNGLAYKVTPTEMQGAILAINYISRENRQETLTLRVSLQYTVSNAVERESLTNIKQKAPQQYYTQGRMITGEDYNILPYTSFSDVIKAKAVNRTSSGVSRFLDVIDTSGKYSSTNIFGQDGLLYREENTNSRTFSFSNTSEIPNLVQENILSQLSGSGITQFYYSRYPQYNVVSDQWRWDVKSLAANGATGFIVDSDLRQQKVGNNTTTTLRYLQTGSLVRFRAPTGYHFTENNQLVPVSVIAPKDKDYVYVTVTVTGDGTDATGSLAAEGIGSMLVNEQLTTLILPDGSIVYPVVDYVMPPYLDEVDSDVQRVITENITALTGFGLYFDSQLGTWTVISAPNLDYTGAFSTLYVGDTVGGRDASWLLSVQYVNNEFRVTVRSVNYVFESVKETSFYFDPKVKVYDSRTGQTIKDSIKVLGINTKSTTSDPLSSDYEWQVTSDITESDGYVNRKKVLVTFADSDNDGIPDNPDIFSLIVGSTDLVFFEEVIEADSFIRLSPVTESVISTYATLSSLTASNELFITQQLFYTTLDQRFYRVDIDGAFRTFVESLEFIAKAGRNNLYFQYRHNSPDYRRIDPTPNNVIDLYLLTTAYEEDYRRWVQDNSGKVSEAVPPTTNELQLSYSSLENLKAVSDTIVYHSASFKPLFGSKATPSLRAKFKVIKNPSVNVSDNEVKSQVISAINSYFQIENWDFGESFFFSELSAYLHTVLTPNVVSIVIVPSSSDQSFGSMLQVNAEFNEILISAATVDNIEIINAITAAQLLAS